VVVAGNVLTSAGFAATALASTVPGYAGAVCIWTLAEIAMTTAGAAIVAGLAPPHRRGRYLGLYGAASSLGALLAPLAGTQLLRLGAPALWLACGALTTAAALGQATITPAIRNRTHPDHTRPSLSSPPGTHPASGGLPEVPRGFRTVHPIGWTSGKVK
jgi:MFS family permease